MARCYLDISARGNEYQAYADTPTTWGVPQEGNGKAASASSASVAIAVIDCTSAVAVAGNTLVICGAAAITCVTSGAAANQFNAGTGATLATNLAASINAATSTVAAAASALTLAIQYFLYARVNPGNSSQVQIMTRCAGSDMNNATNGTMVITNNTWTGGTAPIYTQFTGGVDGPWAYYINSTTVFGKTIGLYGLRAAAPPTPYNPTLPPSGATPGDYIEVRCARSSSPITLSISTSVAFSATCPSNRHFLFDSTGSTWPGDSGQFTLSLTQSAAANVNILANGIVRETARSKSGYRVYYSGVSGSNCQYSTAAGSAGYGLIQENVCFEEANSNSVLAYQYISGWSYRPIFVAKNCTYKFKSGHSVFISATNSIGGAVVYFLNGDYQWSGLSGDVPGLVDFGGLAVQGPVVVEVIGGTISTGPYGVTSGLKVGSISFTSAGSSGSRFIFRLPGLKSPAFGFTANQYPAEGEWVDPGIDKGFRYDKAQFVVDWLPNASPPYPSLRTFTPSGKGQSVRVGWYNISGWGASGTNSYALLPEPLTFELYNRLPTASRTLQFDFLAETIYLSGMYPLSKAHVGLLIRYQDGSGTTYYESTLQYQGCLDTNGGSALATASSTWSNILTGFQAMMISYTPANPIGQNTTISAQLVLAGTPTGNTSLYFDRTPLVT